MLKTIKNAAIALITMAAVYFSVVFPQAIGQAVKQSVDRCLTVIIPSMFIFLCITTFISRSNIHSIIVSPLKAVSEKFFRLPKEGFAIFLLSMISGYPAGIKLINDNLSMGNITEKQAKAMNSFCFFSGPAFITGTAAAFLYPDSNGGFLVFISCIVGNLFVMLISTRKLDKIRNTISIKFDFKSNQLISSVKSASSAMLQMCVMIAAFGGFIAILNLSGIIYLITDYTSGIFNLSQDTTKIIILSLLEISNIITLPPMQPQLFPVVAFLLSFGGICVHMQVAALADSNFSFSEFFIARVISATVTAITAHFLLPFLNIDAQCSIAYKAVSENSYSPIPSILLVFMMIMLMGLFKEKKKD